MINPSRQQVKKAIRRLARMTGLTIAQVRPTFTSGVHRAGVVNLVQSSCKFEKQTAENIRLECDFLIVHQAVWLAIPYTVAYSGDFDRLFVEVAKDRLKAIPWVRSVEHSAAFLPSYQRDPHAQ